jgi:ribonuclease Z
MLRFVRSGPGSLMARTLTVLGTAAGVPTRLRNHNGYVLQWDDELLLFDPGEGTQRQMLLAQVSVARLTRVCITHFHGDHSLGLPGVLQTRAADRPDDPVDIYFPAEGLVHFEHLYHATVSGMPTWACPHPTQPGHVADARTFTLHAEALDHRAPALGWRIEDRPARRMLPDRLEAAGVSGPDVGRLIRAGTLDTGHQRVHLEDVSVERRPQRFAFVMDTRLCDAAFRLAQDADLLVCEATFLQHDADLASDYGHLTAAQAARIAAEAGARRLVLTHFSQRYGDDPQPFLDEARAVFDDVVVVNDLDRVDVPPRADA